MTNFSLFSSSILDSTAHTLIIPMLTDQDHPSTAFAQIDSVLGGTLARLKSDGIFSAKLNQTHVVNSYNGLTARFVLLVGLGDSGKFNAEALRKVAGTVSRQLQTLQAKDAAWVLDGLAMDNALAQSLVEGSLMGSYNTPHYRKSDSDTPTKVADIRLHSSVDLTSGIRLGRVVGTRVNTARDLANTPANLLTPSLYETWIRDQFSCFSHITVDVIDAARAKELGMNLFLGVSQGSVEPPFMVVLRYMPVANQAPIALVGKGVTFDSGGISIKPANKMSDMKGDMSGSAAVVATMLAVAELTPNRNILAVVALTENMPSGTALKPSDVIVGMNGTSVEIINTDAEGRLVLADALAYAVSEGASELVDIATLTGACSIALGNTSAAIMGNDQALVDRWLAISAKTGERLWQLPLYDEYLDLMKSDVADLINASETRLAGTCTGGKFLEQFVGNTPWVHLDVASMMDNSKTSGYSVKGMSGVGVRNLIAYTLADTLYSG